MEPDDDNTQSYVALTKGTMVQHYRIVEKIGSGGMGEVYLAEDTKLDRKVALKFLPTHLCQDEDCRKRFKREAQAAAKLSHPNIVTVHEVSEYQGRPFFAMEHIKGKSLRDVIKAEGLTPEQVIGLAIQLCEGLWEAHDAGIVHRDIKPSNIILDKKGRPKLLDFGLAAVLGSEKLTKTGSTLGTIGYMSPEQAQGQKADQRSDLFSLGVVIYEMITGRRPFKGKDEAATLHAITHDTPQPLSRFCAGVPDDLQRIVSKLLEKDPTLRYQNAAGVISDLKPLLPSGSRPLTVSAPVSRAKKLTWAAAISLLIIVVAFAGLQLKDWLLPAQAQERSLAVVDFANIGAEEDAYLASGLAEDLAVKLRQLEGFHVASSADIRRLLKENLLPREIAARLGVQYALGGSLLREDTLVRVNVELIDKTTGNVVWSEKIDRQFTEIFQFMDEVSLKIAEALEVRFTPIEEAAMAAKPTDDAEAYDRYLKGRHYYYYITFRDNELAEREFERALQLDPDYPLAMAGLADVYVQRYKERFDYDEYWLDSSKVLIQRALALEPELAEAYESLAEVHLEEDNITGAREAAEKARKLRPNWDEPYVHLGDIFRQRGERSKALSMYDTALNLRASVDALCGKGKVFQTRGEMDSARATYEAATELNPYHDRPYLSLAGLHEDLSEGEEAERLFWRATEIRPDRATGFELLSVSMWNRGSVKEGEDLLRGFVERFPYNWDGYDALYDYVAWHMGDYPAAVRIVEEAVSRNPKRVWPHLLLASSYADQMPPETTSDDTLSASDRAILAIDRALALRPNSGRVLEWAGSVYNSLGRFDEALAFFTRALELRPRSSDLLTWIAWTYRDMGQNKEAAQYALQAVRQSPGSPWGYYYLKSVMTHPVDRWEEYFGIIRQAAEVYGDDPLILYMLSQAQCLSGQYEQAIETARRSLEAKSTSFSFGQIAIALWLSGDVETALTKFREATTNYYFPGHWIVAILKSEGRFDEVESYLEDIKTNPPSDWSGMDFWAWIAPPYYRSMRQYDNALAVYTEYFEGAEATWFIEMRMGMVSCYKQKGILDSSRCIMERLADTSAASYVPYILAELAILQAIDSKNLIKALELAERAQAESITPNDNVTEPLLRLQYASGRLNDVAESVKKMGSESRWKSASHPYRKAQLAEAIGMDDAPRFLSGAISSLTRLSRGEEMNWAIGDAPAFLALALARARRTVEARRQIEWALKLEPEREDIAYNAACAYSLIGDTTLALQWLETAVDREHLELWWARVDPDLDPLRELPRFKEIMTDWDSRIQAMLEKSGGDDS